MYLSGFAVAKAVIIRWINNSSLNTVGLAMLLPIVNQQIAETSHHLFSDSGHHCVYLRSDRTNQAPALRDTTHVECQCRIQLYMLLRDIREGDSKRCRCFSNALRTLSTIRPLIITGSEKPIMVQTSRCQGAVSVIITTLNNAIRTNSKGKPERIIFRT